MRDYRSELDTVSDAVEYLLGQGWSVNGMPKEDLVQEIFLHLYKYRVFEYHDIKRSARKTRVRYCVRKRMITLFKKHRRLHISIETSGIQGAIFNIVAKSDDSFETTEFLEGIMKSLGSDLFRDMFRMYFIEDKGKLEVVRLLGIGTRAQGYRMFEKLIGNVRDIVRVTTPHLERQYVS